MAAQRVCIFLLIIWPIVTREQSPSAETCDEKYVNLQLAHSRLQVEHFRLRQQTSSCPHVKRNPSDIIIIKGSANQVSTSQPSSPTNANLPRNCKDVATKKTGIYELQELAPGRGPLRVICDFDLHGGGWTVIQRRINGTVIFNRPWSDYKKGFGNVENEYWLGLENIHLLTMRETQELLFYIEDFDNQKKYALYAGFALGDEGEKYAVTTLGKYTGDAGDSFSGHLTHKFSTRDQDNDGWSEGNCAGIYQGGWWFNRCLTSNLNGPNVIGEFDNKGQCCRGLHWLAFRGAHYSLKQTTMMIRPLIFNN